MLNLKEFVKETLINGIENGSFTREFANITAANYVVKGILSEADLEEIDNLTKPVEIEEYQEETEE